MLKLRWGGLRGKMLKHGNRMTCSETRIELMFDEWFPDPRCLRGSLRISLMCLAVMGLIFTNSGHSYDGPKKCHMMKNTESFNAVLNILLYTFFGLILINAVACPQFYSRVSCTINHLFFSIITAVIVYMLWLTVCVDTFACGTDSARLWKIIHIMAPTVVVYTMCISMMHSDMHDHDKFIYRKQCIYTDKERRLDQDGIRSNRFRIESHPH